MVEQIVDTHSQPDKIKVAVGFPQCSLVLLGDMRTDQHASIRGLGIIVDALDPAVDPNLLFELHHWTEEVAIEAENRVEGSAVDFARVVTQVRNIADTQLEVSGPIATEWMGMAQCFAGAAEPPPPPGSRYRAEL